MVTDFCGLVSGDKVDKSTLFETFTGSLPGAPMIASFPLTAECRLLQSVPLGVDTLYLAEIVVAMDFFSQLQAHLQSHQYGSLMKKANLMGYGRSGAPQG